MKKIFAGLLMAVMAMVMFVQPVDAKAAKAADKTAAATAAYTYTSEKYGFSIECPQKPVAVLDLSLTSNQKGVMMIYDNQGMDVTYDWVVLTEAFTTDTFPDFTRISQEQLDEFLKELVKKDYGFATIAPVEGVPAVYMLGINEDVAKTYFTGKNGQNYGIVMHTTTDKFKDRVDAYQQGLVSFKSIK